MKSIRVACAIICDGERILACQCGHGDLKGGWEFPGGKFEPSKTDE